MLKKIIISLMLIAVFILTACQKEVNPYEIDKLPDDFTYYQSTKLNEDKHLYVFGEENNRTLSSHELILGQAIQGLFAQDRVTFYLATTDPYKKWLTYLEESYGVTSSLVTLETMIEMYKNQFENHGYILYDRENLESTNVATTISGINGWLPVENQLISLMSGHGIEMKLDATSLTEKYLFENYKDELSNKAIIQLKGDINHFRDYGVAFKYLYFYQDKANNAAIKLRSEIHSWAKVDAPIFGWGPGVEDSHVGIASRHGQFTIPSDYSYNTTVFSAEEFKIDPIKQPNEKEVIKAQKGKHYVTIVRSDGDNIQTWYNTFPFSKNDMGAERKGFKFGWSIQPSLFDLAPHIVKHAYETADKDDYFVAAVSGHGYMYPSIYPDLKSFISSMDLYMKRLDLSIIQILDSGPYEEIIEWYSQAESVKGGMYMYGEKYAGGKGEVFWSKNGKPFVSFRESIWDAILVDVATRINGYETDPTHISGYSLVNLHPWSHTYDDVYEVVRNLDDHVVVVSPEVFFDLITQNVEKVYQKP